MPIFKNKGDEQSRSNCRGIKLMIRTMKIWEELVEARLREEVMVFGREDGFTPRKSSTDPMFALETLMDKYQEGQKEQRCVL